MRQLWYILNDCVEIVSIFISSLLIELGRTIHKLFLQPKRDLSKDVILITGAGNGLGRLMCFHFANHCSKIVALDVNKQTLEETARLVGEQTPGCDLRTYVCDLRSHEEITRSCQQILRDVGCVTILINNAAIVNGKMFVDIKSQEFEDCFRVNVFAYFHLMQAFLPAMINHVRQPDSISTPSGDNSLTNSPSAHIVNLASVAGCIPGVGLSDYCATKAANLIMSEAFELELWEQNLHDRIRVTCVCPFLMDTTMFSGCQPKKSWLFPIVDADYCARRVVEAVQNNERRVYVYSRYALLPVLNFLFPFNTLRKMFIIAGCNEWSNQMQEHRRALSAHLHDD